MAGQKGLTWADTNRQITLVGLVEEIEVQYSDVELLLGIVDEMFGALKSAKKQQLQERNAEEQQQAAVALQEWRAREAVKKTAVKISGQILQVVDGGVLFKIYAGVSLPGGYTQTDIARIPELYGNDHVLCLIQDIKTTGLADDQWFGNSTVYPIGTYQYTTVAGGSKAVRKFTVSLGPRRRMASKRSLIRHRKAPGHDEPSSRKTRVGTRHGATGGRNFRVSDCRKIRRKNFPAANCRHAQTRAKVLALDVSTSQFFKL